MRQQLRSPVTSQSHNSSGFEDHGRFAASSAPERLRYLPLVERSALGLKHIKKQVSDQSPLAADGCSKTNVSSMYTFGVSNSMFAESYISGDATDADDMPCGLSSMVPLEAKPPRLIRNLESNAEDSSNSLQIQSSTPHFSSRIHPRILALSKFAEQHRFQHDMNAGGSRKQSWNSHDSVHEQTAGFPGMGSRLGHSPRHPEHAIAFVSQQVEGTCSSCSVFTLDYHRHFRVMQ